MKKRIISVALLLALTCLTLLILPAAAESEGEEPVLYGTISTATLAAEADGVLYFLYPGDSMDWASYICAYDTQEQTFRTVAEAEPPVYIKGLQVQGRQLYYLTGEGLYVCDLDTQKTQAVYVSPAESSFEFSWFFLQDGTFYLCRSGIGPEADGETVTQLVTMTCQDTEVTVLAGDISSAYTWASLACYWDGRLYTRRISGFDAIQSINLTDGSTREEYDGSQGESVSAMFTTADGVVYQTYGSDSFRLLDGTEYLEEPTGSFIGCNGDSVFYRNDERALCMQFTRTDRNGTETLTGPIEREMLIGLYDGSAVSCGGYILFFSPQDLGGEELSTPENDGQGVAQHYFYLLDGGQVTKLTHYEQMYIYA